MPIRSPLQTSTPWVRKETPYSCIGIYLHQLLIDFRNSFTDTPSRKFETKRSKRIHPQTCRYIILWNMCSKITPTAATATADHERTHWEYCANDRWIGTKPRRRAANLLFIAQNIHSAVVRIAFSPRSWFEGTVLEIRYTQCYLYLIH